MVEPSVKLQIGKKTMWTVAHLNAPLDMILENQIYRYISICVCNLKTQI